MVKKARAQRKPRGGATAGDETVKPSEVRPAITQAKLRSLMASARRAQNDITEIAGGFGAEIKNAVEKNHLHRKAFNVIKSADRMEPEKLADFFDCLDHYRDISGLNDRASQVQRLGLEEQGEEEGDGEGESTVRPFPRPHGMAAE